MTGYQETTRKRSALGPWLIGCGLLLVLVLVGGGGVAWWWAKNSFSQDPARVQQVAAQMLPGARAPEGYTGRFTTDLSLFGVGFRMAFFAPQPASPSADGRLHETAQKHTIIVVCSGPPGSEAGLLDGIHKQLNPGESEFDRTIEDLGEEKIPVGGTEITFRKRRETSKGRKSLQFYGRYPGQGDSAVLILIAGPEASFDRKAMDAFLATVAKPAGSAKPDTGSEAGAGTKPAAPKSGSGK